MIGDRSKDGHKWNRVQLTFENTEYEKLKVYARQSRAKDDLITKRLAEFQRIFPEMDCVQVLPRDGDGYWKFVAAKGLELSFSGFAYVKECVLYIHISRIIF